MRLRDESNYDYKRKSEINKHNTNNIIIMGYVIDPRLGSIQVNFHFFILNSANIFIPLHEAKQMFYIYHQMKFCDLTYY